MRTAAVISLFTGTLFACWQAEAQPPAFNRTTTIKIKSPWIGNGSSVVASDLDGDGVVDLAMGHVSSSTLSVILMAKGEWEALAVKQYYGGRNSTYIFQADLDLDGRVDLVSRDPSASTLTILKNAGDGAHTPLPALKVDPGPASLAACDLNEDGIPDLIVGHSQGLVSVLLGSGEFTYKSPGLLPRSDPTPASAMVQAGDLNNDGHFDLITAYKGSAALSVRLGNGDGSFQSEQTVESGSDSGVVALADLNRDGKPDIVTASTALLAEGGGRFQPPRAFQPASALNQALAVGDWDGDGSPDLAVCGNRVSVFWGNGDVTFLESQERLSVGAVAVASADFDDDAQVELAFVGGGSVRFFKARKDRGLVPQNTLGQFYARWMTSADFTGDGLPDIAVSSTSQDRVFVLAGTSAGDLEVRGSFLVGAGPWEFVDDDFNQDSLTDLAVANIISGEVSILMGGADGMRPPRSVFRRDGAGSLMVYGIRSADVNNDGRPDLVSTLQGGSIGVLLWGDDWFQQLPVVTASPMCMIDALAVADFTGDSSPDILLALETRGVRMFPGRGDGSLSTPIDILPTKAALLEAADLDGDSRKDLLVAYGAQLQIFLNDGSGKFGPPKSELYLGDSTISVVSADFDGDAKKDLVVSSYYGIQLLIGNGDGTFQSPQRIPSLSGNRCILAADLNRDGRIDLAMPSGDGIAILWNDPPSGN